MAESDALEIPDANRLLARLPLLRAWRTLTQDDSDFPERSFVVEFAGMPKAGKSTSIEGVRHFFTHGYKTERWKNAGEWIDLHYRVHTPAEGVSLRTPARLKRNAIDFNTWAGAYALQELLQAAHDGYNDLVVLDRGPWDASCWLEYWRDTAHGSAELDEVSAFFRRSSWMTRSDVHVVLVVEPGEATDREKEDRLIQHGGASSNLSLMKQMFDIYNRRFKELQTTKRTAAECAHVGNSAAILIDTTHLETKQGIAAVINAIFDVLEAKVNKAAEDRARLSQSQVRNQLDRYWARMKNKKSANEYLQQTFVPSVNDLEPWRRLVVQQRLAEMALPESLVEGRTPADEVMSTLDDVLKTVQAL